MSPRFDGHHRSYSDPLDGNLTESELRFLAALGKRASKAIQSRPVEEVGSQPRNVPEMLRFACLAVSAPELLTGRLQSALHGVDTVNFRPQKQVSYAESAVARRIVDRLLHVADEFLSNNPEINFLVLSEMAFSVHEEMREEVASRWQSLATRYSCIILPGTFHCSKHHFGAQPVIVPGADHQHAPLIYKHNSATKQGEIISTPDVRDVRILSTTYGSVCVWICLDLYDAGLVFKLLNQTMARQDRVRDEAASSDSTLCQIVLVPSCNADRKNNLLEAVETLSEVGQFSVFLVNWAPEITLTDGSPRSERLESFAAVAGESLPSQVMVDESSDTDGVRCKIEVYEVAKTELDAASTRNRSQSGVQGSVFRGIIGGANYTREVPE